MIDATGSDEREHRSYALHFPDGCPGFWQGLTPWLQHSMLKILLCSPSHVVAGLWHWPPQNTSLVAQEHEQVASLKICPPVHWSNTHAPLHSRVSAGHSQAQVVGLRWNPGSHGVRHVLLHTSVPGPHSHWQVVSLSTKPFAHSVTHCPLHSTVPGGHSHTQVSGLRTNPTSHGARHWPPQISGVPLGQTHEQPVPRTSGAWHGAMQVIGSPPSGHSSVPCGHTHSQVVVLS